MEEEIVSRFVSEDPNLRFELQDFSIGATVKLKYPGEWFEAHPRSKPVITLPKYVGGLNSLRQTVVHNIVNDNCQPDSIKAYLHEVFQTQPSQLTDRWISFGLVIQEAGQPCHLSDLYEVQQSKNDVVVELAYANLSAKDDPWIVIYCGALYRLLNVNNETYRKVIMEKVQMRLSANHVSKNVSLAKYSFFKPIMNDPEYLKMVALIDMYLSKFSKHNFADARVGTISTRFKDCAALQGLDHLKSLTGLKVEALKLWIWHKKLAEDIIRIMFPGQEIDKADSYMPYFMELGLSDKSPYSAVVNPNFHTWLHVVGICQSNTRSKNAICIEGANMQTIMAHAMILAYALKAKLYLTEDGGEPPKLHDEDLEEENEQADVQDLPRTLLGNEWYGWFKDQGFSVPNFVETHFRKVIKSFVTTRPNTIARLMFDLFGQPEEAKK